MRAQVIQAFTDHFGTPPTLIVRAPGRANLIGEHTDYHEGFVMPLAVNQAIWIAAAPRDDDRLGVYTLDFGQTGLEFGLDQLQDEALPHWTAYLRGAWWLLHQHDLFPPGANVVIGSQIPVGAGMSSSAAIGVAALETGLALLNGIDKTQEEKALLAVEIEHRFIGVPCGVMDQMAAAAALDGTVMLLDCRSLERTAVDVPDAVRIVVIDSAKPHDLTQGNYKIRRQESEEAARQLGVRALRDATLELLHEQRDALDDLLYQRAYHVVTENARTLAMQTALKLNRLDRAGELLNESHASLRDQYEVSVAELDTLTELARQHPACYGARIMGGGFGGSAVCLVKTEGVEAFQAEVGPAYMEAVGLTPRFFVCTPSAGSSVECLDT